MSLLSKVTLAVLMFFGSAYAEETEKTLEDLITEVSAGIEKKIPAGGVKVAVMNIPSIEGLNVPKLSSYISNKITNRMIVAGHQIVERASLDKILSEMKLQSADLMDASTRTKLGKLSGAKVLLMGNFTLLPYRMQLTLRALSVETGQYLGVSEGNVELYGDALSTVFDLTDNVYTKLRWPYHILDQDQKVCDMLKPEANLSEIIIFMHKKSTATEEEIRKLNTASLVPNIEVPNEPSYMVSVGNWYFLADTAKEDQIQNLLVGKSFRWPLRGWVYKKEEGFFASARCLPDGSLKFNNRRGDEKNKK